jgi:hypothetical protein
MFLSYLIYLSCCIPQWRRISSIVGYNRRKPAVLLDTVHCIRFCCGVGYNGRKFSCVVGYNIKNLFVILRLFSVVSLTGKIHFCCIPQRRKTLSIVSHSGKKLFSCIPQRKKNSSVVSHNGKKTLNLNGFTEKNFSAK